MTDPQQASIDAAENALRADVGWNNGLPLGAATIAKETK